MLVPHLQGPAVHDAPLSRRRLRQGVLPEGRADAHARLDPALPRARLDARQGTRRRSGSSSRVVNDELALLWMVNMGCIDMNTWYSRVDKPDRPDFVPLRPRPDAGGAVGADDRGGADPQGAARPARARRRSRRPPAARASTCSCRSTAARRTRTVARVRRGRRRRDRARASEARDDRVVEGAPARRPDRLEPERRGEDDRVRLLRAPEAGRAGLDAAALGRGERQAQPVDLHDAVVLERVRDARRPLRRRADDAAVAAQGAQALGFVPAACAPPPSPPSAPCRRSPRSACAIALSSSEASFAALPSFASSVAGSSR